MNEQDQSADVLIVGAGIVGLLAALLYARAGFSVTLVERAPLPAPRAVPLGDKSGGRTVALTWRSVQLLQSADLWQAGCGCAIQRVHVSEQGRFAAVRMVASEFDIPALGAVVANATLEDQLFALARDHDLIRLVYGYSVQSVEQSESLVQLAWQAQNRRCSAVGKLLLAVDGSESVLRDWLGIGVRRRDYQQRAIVANVGSDKDHQHVAYERFTALGPLAMLPLAKQQYSMVCTLQAESAREWLQLSDNAFLQRIQKTLGGRLGRLQSISERISFPLSLIEAEQQVAGRCVLLGNAARTLHPVAGQGLNLAIRDVFQLVASIGSDAAVGYSRDPASEPVLAHFRRRRKPDQQRVQRQTDLLATVFLPRRTLLDRPLALARSSSMLALDLMPNLRRRFAKMNAGIGVPIDS